MKGTPVRTVLFISYFIPILLTILILSITFFFYTSRVLRQTEESKLVEITDKMVSIIDSEIKNMNNISINITSSEILKKDIAELRRLIDEGYPLESTEVYLAARDIAAMFAMIAGPIKSVPQINYILPSEFLIGSGTYIHIHRIPEAAAEAIKKVDYDYGRRYFSGPSIDPLAETAFPRYSNKQYISLFKTIFDEQNKEPVGIIEVKQFAETIFYGPSKAPRQFMIFDSDFNQLFPQTLEKAGTYTTVLKENPFIGLTSFKNPVTGEKEIISIGKCREIDWTILNVALESQVMKPVYKFLLIIILSALIMFTISITIARKLSVMITVSLGQLHGWIKNMHWETISSDFAEDLEMRTPLVEFEDIRQEFRKVSRKLNESMKLVIRERSLHEHARMLALQSQMDPHFMYNMLTAISIMAEDGENNVIVETINQLTSILRYTASRSRLNVSLMEEADITEKYLKCMKIRFGDNLEYRIRITPEAGKQVVPKLIILPFAENSIKYATTGKPPWIIEIDSEIKDGQWNVRITDNGPGFQKESLEKIDKLIRKCDTDIDSQLDFNFDGLGIPNIYSRLKIHFGDKIQFKITNTGSDERPEGSCVIIGGPIAAE